MVARLIEIVLFLINISNLIYNTYGHYGCSSDRINHSKPIRQNMNIKPRSSTSSHTNSNHHHHILEGRAQDPDPNNTIYENIRITYDTSQLEQDWAAYPENRTYFVNDVIPAAFEWLQKVISVRPGI